MDVSSAGGEAPWWTPDAYSYLHDVERTIFAWEWLRRTSIYRNTWTQRRVEPLSDQHDAARSFDLAALLNPDERGDRARPIWLAGRDRRVVAADVVDAIVGPDDRLDVRAFMGRAAMSVGASGVERWRLGDASWSVRLDVRAGTLLGAPTLLAYQLAGMACLPAKLGTLTELVRRAADQGRSGTSLAREARRARWIQELRVADALSADVSQREIARMLFGRAVPEAGWRHGGESYRLRVQRLVRAARARLTDPLDAFWFA